MYLKLLYLRCLKKLYLIITAGFFLCATVAMLLPSVQSADDAFCKVFFKIIRSAVENNFEDIKGTSLGVTVKGYNKIEKWKTTENFEGYEEGYLSKSFGIAYITNLYTSAQMDEAMVRAFENAAFIIDDCLPPSWIIYETPKEGLHKRISISRRDADEAIKFPSITLEINQIEGKYMLQLRIVR